MRWTIGDISSESVSYTQKWEQITKLESHLAIAKLARCTSKHWKEHFVL